MGGVLPVHRERVDLHDLAEQVVDEVRPPAGRRLELVRAAGWGGWDPDRIAQVVGNLVSNAMHYSRAGTPVRVEVRDAGSEVRLSVHNEGAPIPPELQALLFQPFQRGTTGKAATRSVGLGLFIVRQVARAHGGEVEMHSAPGRAPPSPCGCREAPELLTSGFRPRARHPLPFASFRSARRSCIVVTCDFP